ncbi:MAG: cupredoxin domain-containing protein [Hyphomicrobiales bacterium]
MQHDTTYRRLIGLAILVPCLSLGLLATAPGALAQDATTVKLTIKDHKFQPAEAHAPAGKPIVIEIANLDTTPAEFESKTLRVEKVIAGGSTTTIQVRALAAGRYRFFDDYHEDTTQGVLVVQ